MNEKALHFLELATACEDNDLAIDYAQKALDSDPDCLEAAVLLVQLKNPAWSAVQTLSEMREEEEQKLKEKGLWEEEGHLWDIEEARPYIRLVSVIAQEYMDLHWYRQALPPLYDLINLDHDDHLGARFRILGVCTLLERFKDTETLIEHFEKDTVPGLLYTVMIQFKQNKLPLASLTLQKLYNAVTDWEDHLHADLNDLLAMAEGDIVPNTVSELVWHFTSFPMLFLDEAFLFWMSEQLPEKMAFLN